MPHATVKLMPGIDNNETPALNTAGISYSNLIRFVPDRNGIGLIQKLGGWNAYYGSPMIATPRALLAWEDTNAFSHLAIGTDYQPSNFQAQLAVLTNGSLQDITPRTITDNITPIFTTTLGSNVVQVQDSTTTGITTYDSVFIQTQISINGIVLFGQYQCTTFDNTDYLIQAYDSFGNPQLANASSSGGTLPTFTSTSGSATITVTLPNHGYSVGQEFPILVTTDVGGVTLFGNYLVQNVPSANTLLIFAPTLASSGATVTLNSGLVRFVYTIGIGPTTASTGYGAGPYGGASSAYGSGSSIIPSTGTPITAVDWTLDNWGETLLSCPVPASQGIFLITGASGNGVTATVTFNNSYLIPVGTEITITGVVPTAYNGTYVVTASTSGTTSSVSYASSATGSVTTPIVTWYNNSTVTIGWQNNSSVAVGWSGSYASYGELIFNISNAKNGYSPIMQWDPTGGVPIATAIPQAPPVNDGIFVAMPQRQIIAWGSTFTGVQDPLLLRWCDVEDYTVWSAQSTNEAGSFRIPKGSKIVGCIQGPQQGLIWTDIGFWSMQYIGAPLVYSFNELGTGCGLIARKAAASLNGVVYWMGQTQFYRLSPAGVEIIPCPIWDTIFQNLDTNNLYKIRIAPNSQFGEVTWYYPSSNGNGEVDSYVKFNVLINQWDYGSLSRTAWINQSVLGPPIGASSDLYIYQHETSPDAAGTPMNSSFQTGYFVMSEADVKLFIDQIWPDMNWGYYDGTPSATIKLTFYVKDYPGQTPLVYGPFTLTQGTTFVTPRFRGRLTSMKLESNDIGSWWRIGAMRYRYQIDGRY
jgi:hypothetical protein